MRVIAGDAKGHALKAPKGMSTRPMADKVKGAVFSMLSNLLAQSDREWGKVLDLYSGSGSIGIEALSRGADWADFVEINAGVSRIISENLEHTHLSEKGRVNNRTVQNFLNSPSPAPKNKVRAQGGLQWRKGGSLSDRKARRVIVRGRHA
jgi:16S rRNA (guanine966-N2)-methyltransferase